MRFTILSLLSITSVQEAVLAVHFACILDATGRDI